jgi:processive 1,2-diacylglycerol beta-glucosyltransferase
VWRCIVDADIPIVLIISVCYQSLQALFVCQIALSQFPWSVIWVLTAGFGDGHNSAAYSTAEALRRDCPDEPILATDLIAQVHPWLAPLLQAAYQWLIIHAPWLWKWGYQMMANPSVATNTRWLRPLEAAIETRLIHDRPRAIVSTYPLYASLLDHLRRRGTPVPPLITIVTDSITVHPIWYAARSDALCVADSETKAVMQAAGLPSATLWVTGFPVSLRIAETASSGRQGILYMPSTPNRHVEATLETLRPLMAQGQPVTLVTGRHSTRLFHTLRRFTDRHPDLPFTIIGWTAEMPKLLRSHQIIICKAGGAILHEVLAAGIPAIIDYIVPGQEEGNAEYLVNHGCGLVSHNPQHTATLVADCLVNQASKAKQMSAAMGQVAQPHAAKTIADIVHSISS